MSSTRPRTQSGGKAERPCRIVRVTVTKHHLAVFDQLEDCLRDPVVMSRRGFETGGPLGYRIFMVRSSSTASTTAGVSSFPPGCCLAAWTF